jgi:hypothetical protein
VPERGHKALCPLSLGGLQQVPNDSGPTIAALAVHCREVTEIREGFAANEKGGAARYAGTLRSANFV